MAAMRHAVAGGALLALLGSLLAAAAPASPARADATRVAPLPSLSVGDASIVPSRTQPTTLSLPVTLSATSTRAVDVRYRLVAGTATPATDYLDRAGVLRFSPDAHGAASVEHIVAVTIRPDAPSTSRSFVLRLVDPQGATLASATGTGTILATPPGTGPTLGVGDVMVLDGRTGPRRLASVPVTLSAPAPGPVTVAYATSAVTATSRRDYVAAHGTLTIPAGASEASLVVHVEDSAPPEPSKALDVELSDPGGGVALGRRQAVVVLGTLDDVTDAPASLATATLTVHRSTSGRYDTYRLQPRSGGALLVTAARDDQSGNGRVVFWPSDEAPSAEQESCATWAAQSPAVGNGTARDAPQEGLALRVASSEGVLRAVTITKNVYAGADFTINVHLWDTSLASPFMLLKSFDMASAVVTSHHAYLPFPWDVCGEVVGATVSFKLWPASHAEPSWGEAGYSGSVEVPAAQLDELPAVGVAGWYFGHVQPSNNLTYANLVEGAPH